jgi:hypothetical protein
VVAAGVNPQFLVVAAPEAATASGVDDFLRELFPRVRCATPYAST